MDGCSRNSDETQRARLAQLLRDPVTYFAAARRQAHAQARRLLVAQLAARGVDASR